MIVAQLVRFAESVVQKYLDRFTMYEFVQDMETIVYWDYDCKKCLAGLDLTENGSVYLLSSGVGRVPVWSGNIYSMQLATLCYRLKSFKTNGCFRWRRDGSIILKPINYLIVVDLWLFSERIRGSNILQIALQVSRLRQISSTKAVLKTLYISLIPHGKLGKHLVAYWSSNLVILFSEAEANRWIVERFEDDKHSVKSVVSPSASLLQIALFKELKAKRLKRAAKLLRIGPLALTKSQSMDYFGFRREFYIDVSKFNSQNYVITVLPESKSVIVFDGKKIAVF